MNSEIKSVGILIVLIGVLIFGWHMYTSDSPKNTVSIGNERTHIEKFFNEYTPEEAYSIFKKENKDDDIASAHTSAHIFGEVLYEKVGLPGFSVCDAGFGFGCYHSFVSFAIAEHGIVVAQELDKECVSSYGLAGLGCSHGIGHGVLSYYGYGKKGIETALSVCDSLLWKRPYGGCRDGVFMEYNFRIMEAEPTKRNRPFSIESRNEPCDFVQKDSRMACYFNQPEWWRASLMNEPDLIEKLVGFCEEVSNENERQSCFRGIGYSHAPQVHFDPSEGSKFCDKIHSPSNGRVWCREGLAWAMYADPTFRSGALLACTIGLSPDEAEKCKNEYLFVIQ